MELDQLKHSWEQLSMEISKKEHLSRERIDHMIQNNYRSNMNKIVYPERIGIIICLTAAGYIATTFSRLDTIYLKGAGILTVVLLLALSVISFISIRRFRSPIYINKKYSETLKDFANSKLLFHKLQKINVLLSYVLLVTSIILLSKYVGNKDITGITNFWLFSFSFGYVFLLFFSRWVLKYYNKSLKQTEELLLEIA
ncbi:MAG: hypothetical protein WKF35_08370 [Ferruginibacter sp.]